MSLTVPGEPLLSPGLFISSLLGAGGEEADVLAHPRASLYRLGRDALAAAVSALPPGPALAPAYICREAVDALAGAGRDVLFYPLGPQLNPDWDALEAIAGGTSGAGPAALVLVHYFGIPADARRARGYGAMREAYR